MKVKTEYNIYEKQKKRSRTFRYVIFKDESPKSAPRLASLLVFSA